MIKLYCSVTTMLSKKLPPCLAVIKKDALKKGGSWHACVTDEGKIKVIGNSEE